MSSVGAVRDAAPAASQPSSPVVERVLPAQAQRQPIRRDGSVTFDETCVIIDSNPLSNTGDGVKRRMSLPPMPPLIRRRTTDSSISSRRLSLTSLLPTPPKLRGLSRRLSATTAPSSSISPKAKQSVSVSAPTSPQIASPTSSLPSDAPVTTDGARRSYTAPPPMGRWPPPPTIPLSPCCKDCESSTTQGEEEGWMPPRSPSMEKKRRVKELEIALGLRSKDDPAQTVSSSVEGRSSVEGYLVGDGPTESQLAEDEGVVSPVSPKMPVTPSYAEPQVLAPAPKRTVGASVESDLATLAEDEEHDHHSPSSLTKAALTDSTTHTISASPAAPNPSSPLSCKGIWLCTPPSRSPVSCPTPPFPVSTIPTTPSAQHNHQPLAESHIPRSNSSTTLFTLASLRRRRPIVTRAMSTGRMATEFDEHGTVVCLSLHSERVLSNPMAALSCGRGPKPAEAASRESFASLSPATTRSGMSNMQETAQGGETSSERVAVVPSEGSEVSRTSSDRSSAALVAKVKKKHEHVGEKWRRKSWGMSMRA